ncbi:UPF0481 protein At3g47200-like [Durio zibethinus]|uniref:UPF0481 protein At3g47200-like n=1 Tax=Durio zibethinus TaxID=66656 RepID=A0A6P5X1J2_DURZI|nr:UPF0481 protein At3g47200-like [Durio zibethinus]
MARLSEQAELLEDPVCIDIDKMLKSLSEKSSEPCISKVPNYLRQVNQKAYEPQVISIGPYHRGKDHLEAMEEQKLRMLQKLLEEREENRLSVFVMKMRELEDKARKCYAEHVSDHDSDDLVKVLLLDGVFVVQLIRWRLVGCPNYLNDMVDCYKNGLWNALYQDMLLVENQLTFFVLRELFCLIVSSRADKDRIFKEAIYQTLGGITPGKMRPRDDLRSLNLLDIKHLLDFTHHCCFHPSTSEVEARKKNPRDDNSTSEMKDREENPRDRNCFISYIKHLPDLRCHCFCHPSSSQKKNELNFIRCATELKEAGIKFKLVNGNPMFDIWFENGTLHVPEIKIEDYTEPVLRNLIAYEQLFLADRDLKFATDYMFFMDYLIDSPKDVEILCQQGIIKNMLGDDKAVAAMINALSFGVTFSPSFHYTEVFNKINEYRSRRWNSWMANLKHNYFNSPWALISFLAAALLLLLTLLQTVFSVLSYAQ